VYRDKTLAVVVPCRQAAERIGAVLRDLPSFVDRVIVVDDASTDGTAALARRIAGADKARLGARVDVLTHPSPLGPGAATLTGYRAALAIGHELVLCLDDDAHLDGADVPALLDPIVDGRADFVKGSRLDHPEARRLPRAEVARGRVLAALSRWLTGARVLHDAGCLHHAMTGEALRCLPMNELWRGDAFFLDLLSKVQGARLVAIEVPVRPTSRCLVNRRVPHRLLLVAARSALARLKPRRINVLPPTARSAARVGQARELNPPPARSLP